MSKSLEARLRDALTAEAVRVDVPDDAWAQFTTRLSTAHQHSNGHDEHDTRTEDPPRERNGRTDLASWSRTRAGARSRWQRPALVAAAAAVIVGAVSLNGTVLSPSAYASWASTPTALDPAAEHAAAAACRMPSPEVTDRRGHNVYLLSVGPTSTRSCLTTLPGLSDEGLGLTYESTTQRQHGAETRPDAAHPLRIVDVKSPEGTHVPGQPKPVSFVGGQVSPTVTRVVVQTSKGEVTASLSNGWFAAWWPGNDTDSASVRAYGVHHEQVAFTNHLTRLDSASVSTGRVGE